MNPLGKLNKKNREKAAPLLLAAAVAAGSFAIPSIANAISDAMKAKGWVEAGTVVNSKEYGRVKCIDDTYFYDWYPIIGSIGQSPLSNVVTSTNGQVKRCFG